MSYTTLSQALGALSSVAATQDGITAFVRQLSVEASGSTQGLANNARDVAEFVVTG